MVAVWFAPGPIDGCYTYSDVSTAGHNFLFLSSGRVKRVFEYGTAEDFGPYRFQKGRGWIWSDPATHRLIYMEPHLLWVRFTPADSMNSRPKHPFEFRYINFLATRSILSAKGLISKSGEAPK